MSGETSAVGPGFFSTSDDGSFAPRPHAHSPWGVDLLNGRLLAGLAVRLVEHEHGSPGLQVSRVTAELFRSVPMVPVRLEAIHVRDGRRIRLVDVTVTAQERPVLKVRALLLAGSAPPEGSAWDAGPWEVPGPEDVETVPPDPADTTIGFPELRPVGPPLGTGLGPAGAWMRDRCPLIDGDPMSPLQRTVLAADLANPVGNWGSHGLGYINADVTAHVVRPPAGPWIGLEVVAHLAHAGRAVAICRLHDRTGPIGASTVTSMVPSAGTQPVWQRQGAGSIWGP